MEEGIEKGLRFIAGGVVGVLAFWVGQCAGLPSPEPPPAPVVVFIERETFCAEAP